MLELAVCYISCNKRTFNCMICNFMANINMKNVLDEFPLVNAGHRFYSICLGVFIVCIISCQ